MFHVDMDCFYAACERLRNPELSQEPIVIGMGYEQGKNHGVVATASYEAREVGVESTQPIEEAADILPPISETEDSEEAGHYFPVDMEFYQSVSADVKEILHDSAETVREVSVDEAYLDVTEQADWESVEAYAQQLKKQIKEDVGVVASIGVAPNMSAAKIASDYGKPDGLYIVFPDELQDFLAPLSLEEIHELGPETARELRARGIETAGDLAEVDLSMLRNQYGSRGEKIFRYARGEDDREVTPADPPKSFLRDAAFTEPTDEVAQQREQVKTLARSVAQRAREHDAMYRSVGLKIITPPFEKHTRRRTLSGPVDNPELVEKVALELLEKEFDMGKVRKIGVFLTNLSYTEQNQADLGSWNGGGAEASNNSTPVANEESKKEDQTSLSDF